MLLAAFGEVTELVGEGGCFALLGVIRVGRHRGEPVTQASGLTFELTDGVLET